MKRLNIILLLITIIVSVDVMAQDLIITNSGDTLNCKITKIKSDFIYFTFNHKGEIRNTLLAQNQIKTYQQNFYSTSEVPLNIVKQNGIYPRWRISINGGYTSRIGRLPKDLDPIIVEHIRGLNSGINLCGDINYFVTEQIGFGIKYSEFNSSQITPNITVTYPDNTMENGTLSDMLKINFLGPVFSTRLYNSTKKNSLFMAVGIGYMGYKEISEFTKTITITGNTLGICYDFGYDIGITKEMALGLQLSLYSGTLKKYKLNNGLNSETVILDYENYESMAHASFTIGLRFNL